MPTIAERKQLIDATLALAEELGLTKTLPFKNRSYGSFADWSAKYEELKALKEPTNAEPTIAEPTNAEPTNEQEAEPEVGPVIDYQTYIYNSTLQLAKQPFYDIDNITEDDLGDMYQAELTMLRDNIGKYDITHEKIATRRAVLFQARREYFIMMNKEIRKAQIKMGDKYKYDDLAIPKYEKRASSIYPVDFEKLYYKNDKDDDSMPCDADFEEQVTKKTGFSSHINVSIKNQGMPAVSRVEFADDGKQLPREHMIVYYQDEYRGRVYNLYRVYNNHQQYKEERERLKLQALEHNEYVKIYYNEVILPYAYRRIAFDIDRPLLNFKDDELKEIKHVLTDVVGQALNLDIAPNEFAIYVNQHASEPKGSCHIISRVLTLRNYHEHQALYKKVRALLEPQQDKYTWISNIDWGVCKSTQNLRCPHAFKLNSKRCKRIYGESVDPHLLMTEVNENMRIAPTIINNHKVNDGKGQVNGDAQQTEHEMPTIDDDDVDSILKNEVLKELMSDVFEYRSYNNGIINFNRVKPSYCEFCDREHDKDNTLYCCINSNGVFAGCIKMPKTVCKKLIIKFSKQQTQKYSEIYINNIIKKVNEGASLDITPLTADDDIIVNSYCEPAMRKYEDAHILYVRAGMKLGKSKQLVECVLKEQKLRTWNEVNMRLVIISFRRTFTEETKAKFEAAGLPLVDYRDIKGNINVGKHKRVIVQLDSLHRLVEYGGAIVIMDESESIINQLSASTNSHSLECFETLHSLIKQSGRVICMDAYLGERTHTFIRHIKPKYEIVLHENTYQNLSDHKAYITSNRDVFSNKLIKDIENGKRVALATNSRQLATSIYEKVKAIIGADKAMLYAGNDWHDSERMEGKTREAEKHEHMKDINGAIQQFDFIAYTPTMTAGISIEAERFDEVYGYFTADSCDALSAVQMLGRVRCVRNKQYTLCFKAERNDLPVTMNEVFDVIDARRRFMVEYNIMDFNLQANIDGKYLVNRDDFYNKVRVGNMVERNKSRNFFGLYVCQLLRRVGCQVERLEDIFKDEDKELQKELKQVAQELHAADYNEIKNVYMDDKIVNKVTSLKFEPDMNKKVDFLQQKHGWFVAKYGLKVDDMQYVSSEEMGLLDGRPEFKTQCENIQDYILNMKYDENALTSGDIFTIEMSNGKQDKRMDVETRLGSKRKLCRWILRELGFNSIEDDQVMKREALHGKMQTMMNCLKDRKDILTLINSLRERGKPIEASTEFSPALKIFNTILQSTYGIKIKSTNRHKAEEYKLEHNQYFMIDGNQVRLRCVVEGKAKTAQTETAQTETAQTETAQTEAAQTETAQVYDDPEFVMESMYDLVAPINLKKN